MLSGLFIVSNYMVQNHELNNPTATATKSANGIGTKASYQIVVQTTRG